MATERLSPDAVLAQTDYTAINIADIDEDPDSPDASYGSWDGNGNTSVRVSFPTPTGSPTVGAGLQEFRALIRRTGAASLGWSLQLWENGVQISVLATGTLTTSSTVISGTWNASALGTSNGSLVECRVEQTSGGTGGGRQGIEVGAIEWNVNYSTVSVQKSYGQAQAKIYAPVSYYDTVLADAPTVWWRLGDSSGNFLDEIGALDLSPNGTVTRGVKNYRIKTDDGGVTLPTSSDYLSRADNAVFDLGNSGFSIEFWARRMTDSGGYEIIISKGTGAYQVVVDSNDWFAFTKGGIAVLTVSNYAVPADGTWHYYVVTRASTSDTRMYVDGAARTKTFDDTTTTLVDTSSAFNVGRDVTGGDPSFNGSVDELALYNYVLTPTQIANHYAARLNGTPDRIAYISPSGNDITGDGSLTNPWYHIPRAVESVCPGDEIQCRGGTYTVVDTTAEEARGTAIAPIRVNPYPSEKPIFDGGNTTQIFLLYQNCSWITTQFLHVQNFKANQSGTLMVHLNSEGIIFRGLTVTNISGTNAGATDHLIYIGGGATVNTAPRNILIENCWFEGVSSGNVLNGAGLQVFSDPGGSNVYSGQDIIFRNNIVLNADYGALLWGNVSDVEMIHNTFVNVDTGLRVHDVGVTGTVFRDNLTLGNSAAQLVQLTGSAAATITEDYNFYSQGGTYSTLIFYVEGSGTLNKSDWTTLTGNGVHDIVPGSRTDSDFDAGWYPKSGSAVNAASDGFDMGRLQVGLPHAQAQALIVVAGAATLYVNAQSQGWIKATAQKAYAQARANIKQTYRGFGQAQAKIKQTYRGNAQSQAQIKQTYRGFAQAQANLAVASRGFGQAQALIYIPQYARPVADISVTNWIGVVI